MSILIYTFPKHKSFSNRQYVKIAERLSTLENIDVRRATALWAFSEATLGGILHTMKIPLTGIFVGGLAVIFITVIAHNAERKSVILKATLLVILAKALVSPQSPLTAYFAVALQGILGLIFFSVFRITKVAALLLGFFSLLFSSLQKLIILTILFGNEFWESFDLFIIFIINQFGISLAYTGTSISLIIAALYVAVHVLIGIYIGLKAGNLPLLLLKNKMIFQFKNSNNGALLENIRKNNLRKRKRWWKRPSGIIILSAASVFMVISYFSKEIGQYQSLEILIMIIRSFVISFLWFSVISPYVTNAFKNFIEKKKYKHAGEVNAITSLFPEINNIINYSWAITHQLRGLKRIRVFLSSTLLLLLTLDISDEKNLYLERTEAVR